MKTIFAALASASLLAAPMAMSPALAAAQHSGGFHGGGGGGGFRGGGGFHGAGFRSGGSRDGGFRDGGRHHRGFGDGFFFDDGLFLDGALLGFGLDDAFFDPWDYGYPINEGPYGVLGSDPYGAHGYDAGAPPPSSQQYQPQWQAQTHQPQACGSWSWDAAKSQYNWHFC